jgi:hypothetical protein
MSAIRNLLALALAFGAMPAAAYESKFGDGADAVTGKIAGTFTFGTMLRTEAPSPDSYGPKAAQVVGASAGNVGANIGGADLNFAKNRPVSTVLKGLVDVDLKYREFGFFARADAWTDLQLKNGDRPYGNFPNGFSPNTPLSDNGFDPSAKFSNAQFLDAYAYGNFPMGEGAKLDARVGRQTLAWGTAQLVNGGINVVNPVNYPAQLRPGALPQESRLPVGMLYANFASGANWGIDGFLQYEFRHNVMSGCGTFFDSAPYVPTGCNAAMVIGSVGEPTNTANGWYVHRSPDIDASDSGQGGLSLRYDAATLNTGFRGYLMNYHSRTSSIYGSIPNIAGGYGSMAPPAFTRLTDPQGLKYGLIYAENIHLLGASFETRLDPATKAYGELAYRPNQPLNLNVSDLIAAFVGRNPLSALNLARNVNAIQPGGQFIGFDRYKVTTATIGASKVLPHVLGAERILLSGEIGLSHAAGLPDPGILRYGRSDAYGIAAINGISVCTDTTPGKTCAHDGFVTGNAWGYRLRIGANYPAAFFGATLTPSLYLAEDVSGYSYDGTFQKGRQLLRPGLRAEWGKEWFGEIQYTRVNGGKYNLLADRDNVVLDVGLNF